jgi:hypothetical protein
MPKPSITRWRALAVTAVTVAAAVTATAGASARTVSPSPGASRPAAARPAPSHAADGTAGPAVAHPNLTTNTPAPCNKPQPKGYAQCFAIVRTPADHVITADSSGPPSTALTPGDIQSAYSLAADASGSGGSGQTVAVVDAGDDPTAESDLAVFRSQFGLPACTTANGCFEKVNQAGQQGNYPPVDGTWPEEESLDLDAVSSVCPNCHILLVEADVEASGVTIQDLGASVDEAVALGATEVSNSYGTADESAETGWDQYYNHPGVAVTASAGDSGYGVNYPSASQYVTAVGGTTLTQDSSVPRGWDETAWSLDPATGNGTGSGCSAYEPQPPWQAGITADCGMRATADVSADADPASGLAVYDTANGAGGWLQVGGTSLSSPLIAATYALAFSQHGPPPAGTYPSSYLYTDYLAAPGQFNDITQGSNGDCGNLLCNAGPGWDGPTGLGTPDTTSDFRYRAVGSVAGTVTDGATGQPIQGATVTAIPVTASASKSVTTGSDGGYTLSWLPTHTNGVTVSAYGYQPQTQVVSVAAGQTATQNFALTPLVHETVSGTVTAASGTAWPLYAKVSWSDGQGHGGSTFTDPATGQYSLSLVGNSSYTLTATAQYPGTPQGPPYDPATQAITVGTSNLTQDITLPVNMLACTAIGYQPVLSGGTTQSFTGTTVPKGWTVTNINLGYPGYTSTPGWVFNDPGQRGNHTGGSGGFAIVDSDHDGAHHYQDTELTSPVVSLAADKTPAVQFATDLQGATNSTATVSVSTDGGKTWTAVWTNKGSAGIPGPATVVAPLPQAAGQASVKVRFSYLGEWSQWWAIDNAFIGNYACQQQPGGLVVGRVADSSGSGINGATVTSVTNPAEKTTTLATPGDSGVNGGLYDLFVTETGSQQYTATATGYAPGTQSATITTGQVSTLNFSLASG